MKLIATKSYSYDTRRLKAGDEFEATDMHARILVGVRKARYAAEQEVLKPEYEPDDGAKIIDGLRAQAEKLGVSVDGRWGAARLQHEIARAKSR